MAEKQSANRDMVNLTIAPEPEQGTVALTIGYHEYHITPDQARAIATMLDMAAGEAEKHGVVPASAVSLVFPNVSHHLAAWQRAYRAHTRNTWQWMVYPAPGRAERDTQA